MENQTDQNHKHSKGTQRVYAGLTALFFVAMAVVIFKIALPAAEKNGDNFKSQPVAEVRITKNGFVPATLSVKSGTKVVWTNIDSSLHQVAANPYPKATGLPSLRSEILNNAQSYTYVTSSTGNYGYHDQLNPTINGTLVVQRR